MPIITPNSIARNAELLKPIPLAARITVWPFAIVYAALIAVILDPTMLWGAERYEEWASFIDFFHAVSIPIVAILHGLTWFLTQWIVRFRALVSFSRVVDLRAEPTHVLIEPQPHKGDSEIVPLLEIAGSRKAYFVFQQCKFFWDGAHFTAPKYPDTLPISTYHDMVAGPGIVDANVPNLVEQFGLNVIENRIPEFKDLLVQHLTSPFYVFQIFCVLLLVLDEYWIFAVFNGGMITMLECVQVMQRRRSMQTMNDMGSLPTFNVTCRRGGKVVVVSSRDLLPMDVVWLQHGQVAPADLVVVQGSAVCNEAMLTGESTPQMKEALPVPKASSVAAVAANDAAEFLSPRAHGHHIVYSGTQVLSSSLDNEGGGSASSAKDKNAPNFAIGVVIRTGFETKQGELVRTIQHSQKRVAQNAGEAFALIGILLCFAIAASWYVLQRGLANPTKSRWKLFLTCTQIITSVVPPELPLQLTLAATQSMMSLIKLNVFCTEPHRIPLAGKVDVCFFDKTGTITTDEMLFYGVDSVDGRGIRRPPQTSASSSSATTTQQQWMSQFTEMVIAGCHSLVGVEGDKIAGDAMEKASVECLGYKITRPGYLAKGDGRSRRSVTIISRNMFNPVLRRMSCIVGDGESDKYVVAKGSPESMQELLVNVPSQYKSVCRSYTAAGYRVIALAYREIPAAHRSKAELEALSREDIERDLLFAGFAIFECPIKKDAKDTISQMTISRHRCAMITGDSLPTAVAVAREIDMLTVKYDGSATTSAPSSNGSRRRVRVAVLKSPPVTGVPSHAGLECIAWQDVDDEAAAPVAKPDPSDELCVDADSLHSDHLVELLAKSKDFADRIAVWSRCAPQHKETIVGCAKTAHGHTVLMAGDGTNDMGGLKAADVGVAVLNSALLLQNMGPVIDGAAAGAVASPGPASPSAPQVPTGLTPGPYNYLPVPPEPVNPGPDAPFTEQMKFQFANAKRNAVMMQNQKIEKMNMQGSDQRKKTAESAAKAKDSMQSVFNSMLEDDGTAGAMPVVKLGDASVAAPFTCKSRRLTNLCDVLRLGRATIVTTMQMYKIMSINCLVSAYSMGVLFSDGVKFGQSQQIASSVVITATYLTFLRAQPLNILAPDRPIGRVFHPYMIASIFGQFAVHLYSLMSSVALVHSVEPDALLMARGEELEADFAPTLLNSVVFLMSLLTMAATFAVNYQGYPFMTPLSQNRPFLYALLANMALVTYLATEIDPETNELLGIVKMPSDAFRYDLLQLIAFDVLGSIMVEKVAWWTLGRFR